MPLNLLNRFKRLKYYDLFFKNTDCSIAICRLDGRFIEVSDAFCKMLKYSRNELLSMTYKDITHPKDIIFDLTLLQKFLSGEVSGHTWRKRYIDKDGNSIPIIISLKINPEKDKVFIAVICNESESSCPIKKIQEGIDENIIDRTEKGENFKYFNYTISHDFRECLRSIVIYSQLIKDKLHGKNQEIDFLISRIVAKSKKMNFLISDLLSYTKNNGITKIENSSLLKIVNNILSDYNEKIHRKDRQILLHIPKDIEIRTCSVCLISILANLISNAIKYTKNQVRIKAKKVNNRLLVKVYDNGPGIDNKFLKIIFEPFERLNSNIEGSGLGLAISRKYIKQIKGKIGVRSIVGKGSLFWICIKDLKGEDINNLKNNEKGTCYRG